MIEDNMNKVYWVLAVVAIIAVITIAVINPSVTKIRSQKARIEAIDYTAPAVP